MNVGITLSVKGRRDGKTLGRAGRSESWIWNPSFSRAVLTALVNGDIEAWVIMRWQPVVFNMWPTASGEFFGDIGKGYSRLFELIWRKLGHRKRTTKAACS